MQKIIDSIVDDLIKIIEKKPNKEHVAYQFILEELDAGQDGSSFVKHRIKTSGIGKNKYDGAISNSWEDVDGTDGPQQYLLMLMMALSKKVEMEYVAIVRISIVLNIMKFYKIGKFSAKALKKQKRKNINLFKIVIPEDKLHTHYRFLLKEMNEPIRKVINSWSDGFIDRDKKFNKEFQKTFNSSFWELYLFQCFKQLNMEVDFTKPSPDFILYTMYDTLCIEATITNSAQEETTEWDKDALKERIEKSQDEFMNYASIRILNAISSKHKKYLQDYSKLEHVKGNPFIIAIAPFEQPLSHSQNNTAINYILYGQKIEHDLDEVLESNTKEKCKFEIRFDKFIEKKKDVFLDIGIFTTDKYKEISAVIFSTMATLDKAMTQSKLECIVRTSKFHDEKGLIIDFVENDNFIENHLEGLQIHHNPYATNPLDPREFNEYEITHYRYDKKLRFINVKQNNHTIISRDIV